MRLKSKFANKGMSCVYAMGIGALSLLLASDAWSQSMPAPLAPELEPRFTPIEGNDVNDHTSAPALSDPAYDPPARVGRLNAITNSVSLRPSSQQEFTPALRNRPIIAGDSIATGPTGRAEVHMGAHILRIGPNTLVTVGHFDDEQMQLDVPQGVMILHARDMATGEIIEVDAPNAAMVLQHEGVYRADVDADGIHISFAARRGGEADIVSADDAWQLHSDEVSQIDDLSAKHHLQLRVHAYDELDQWSANRDQSEEHVKALQFVSRSTVGYEDLDANGDWEQTQNYGAVWYPRTTDDDWAPYRNGSWTYIEPWGWNWIDEAAWGFAPFHYGRWVHGGSRWGWVPGILGYRPCYAPALVGFLGGPALGLDGQTWAWFPLGYNEPYWPGFRASVGFVHQVNAAHFDTTHPRANQSQHVNQLVSGAVTAAHLGPAADGSVIGRNHLPVTLAAQSRATFLGNAPHATSPARHTALQPSAPVSSSQPPAARTQRAVFHAQAAYQTRSHAEGTTITSGSGASLTVDAQGRGGRQVPHYPQVYRTPVPIGPHNDPSKYYNRPSSGSYNAGAAVYHAAPSYHVPASNGGYVGGYTRAPNPYYGQTMRVNQRYEPTLAPATPAAPIAHQAAMPGHFGGHFGGRR